MIFSMHVKPQISSLFFVLLSFLLVLWLIIFYLSMRELVSPFGGLFVLSLWQFFCVFFYSVLLMEKMLIIDLISKSTISGKFLKTTKVFPPKKLDISGRYAELAQTYEDFS